ARPVADRADDGRCRSPARVRVLALTLTAAPSPEGAARDFTEDTMTDQLTPAKGITVTHYRGASDGVPVVQIDTAQDAGRLRVNLNDGPPLYDGDPERDDAPGAFRGPSAP